MKYLLVLAVVVLSLLGIQEIKAQPPDFDPWAVNVNTPADLALFSGQLEDFVSLFDTLQRQSRCPDEEILCSGGLHGDLIQQLLFIQVILIVQY